MDFEDQDDEHEDAQNALDDAKQYMESKLQAKKKTGRSTHTPRPQHGFHRVVQCIARRGSAPSASTERKFAPMKLGGWSQEQAQHLCPPEARIRKDLKEIRWRMYAPYLENGNKSKSWGTRTDHSDYTAMVFVLVITWNKYHAKGGSACPWSFDHLDEVVES